MGFEVSRFSYSIHAGREAFDELPHRFEHAQRRFQRQPADAEVRGHHALPAHHLEDAHHVFAFAEAVEEHRHGADINGVRAQPDQVRSDARQLVQHHSQPLRPRRDFQAQQPFHRQHVAQVVGERAEIVDAVGERHRLLVELGLAGLLDSGVQEADVRHHPHDGFAVDLQQQPQHAVGGGCCGPMFKVMVRGPVASSVGVGVNICGISGSPRRDNPCAEDARPSLPAS